MLFCHPSSHDGVAVKEIVLLFVYALGLCINFATSSATLIHGNPDDAVPVTQHFGCPIVEFRLTYLAIPLKVLKPTAAQLQPLVEKAFVSLLSWKAWLMNKAGRLVLVKSVINAILVHQLLVLAPKKIIGSWRRPNEDSYGWDARM